MGLFWSVYMQIALMVMCFVFSVTINDACEKVKSKGDNASVGKEFAGLATGVVVYALLWVFMIPLTLFMAFGGKDGDD